MYGYMSFLTFSFENPKILNPMWGPEGDRKGTGLPKATA